MIRKTKNGYTCKVRYGHGKTITAIGSTRKIAWQAAIDALAEVVK